MYLQVYQYCLSLKKTAMHKGDLSGLYVKWTRLCTMWFLHRVAIFWHRWADGLRDVPFCARVTLNMSHSCKFSTMFQFLKKKNPNHFPCCASCWFLQLFSSQPPSISLASGLLWCQNTVKRSRQHLADGLSLLLFTQVMKNRQQSLTG